MWHAHMLGKECHSIGSLGKAWFSILNGKLEVPLKLREKEGQSSLAGFFFCLRQVYYVVYTGLELTVYQASLQLFMIFLLQT